MQELSETNTKKSEKTNEIKKLSTRIDRMTAESGQRKEEVAALQGALGKLATPQAEMDKLRQEENGIFTASKAELEKPLTGIKLGTQGLEQVLCKKKAKRIPPLMVLGVASSVSWRCARRISRRILRR